MSFFVKFYKPGLKLVIVIKVLGIQNFFLLGNIPSPEETDRFLQGFILGKSYTLLHVLFV